MVPPGGKVAELGGQWTGPGQDQVMALAHELGVRTFATYADGRNVPYRQGRLQTYGGDVPPAAPAALVELEQAIVELSRVAASVSAATP